MKNRKAYLAEFLGSTLLVTVIVGAATMGSLFSKDVAVGLILSALAVVAILWVLITGFGSISGAHFNPAVSLVMAYRKTTSATDALIYIILQILGAIVGATLANAMYEKTLFEISTTNRSGYGQFIGEIVATAGLIFIIVLLSDANKEKKIPGAVALWIGTAFFFTSSTAFANPAVTIGRIFTGSVAGIDPNDVAAFIAAQIIGAVIGLGLANALKRK